MNRTGAGSSGRTWWLLAAPAGAVFVCCGGGAGVVVYLASRERPEQTILGGWQLDREASGYNPKVRAIPGGVRLEFRADRTYRLTHGDTAETGSFAVTGRTGRTVKLTLTPGGPGARPHDLFVEVRDRNRLYVDHRTLGGFEVTRTEPPAG